MDVAGLSQRLAPPDASPPAASASAEDLARLQRELERTEERLRNMRECFLNFAEWEAKYVQLHLEYENMVHSYGWQTVQWMRWVRHIVMPRHSNRSRLTLKILSPLIWVGKRGFGLAKALVGGKVDRRTEYQRWIDERETPQMGRLPEVCTDPVAPRPHFALWDTGNTLALTRTVESLRQQTDPNWELWVASAQPLQLPADDRIHQEQAPAGTLPTHWLNARLRAAGDGWLAELRPGDRLAPRAVAILRGQMAQSPDCPVWYADEDIQEGEQPRRDHHFKPDWSPETLRSHDYLGALKLFHAPLAVKVGGFDPELSLVADYDLALKCAEQLPTRDHRFGHVPHVLIHTAPRSRTAEADAQAVRAVQRHLDRQRLAGDVRAGLIPGTQQVRYATGKPLISIIIPSKDRPQLLERAVYSIHQKSSYRHYEVLIVDNQSQQEATHASNAKLAQLPGVRVMDYPHPFNFAAMNNAAVQQAKGEVLLLLNNDTEVLNADWLERMLEHAVRPHVGAVGAKLYFPDDTIQHAGVILGMMEGTAGHYHRFYPRASHGYQKRLMVAQNLQAVTAACVMMRRSVFEQIEGFDTVFASDFNDVDLCLRVVQAGYDLIWTPFAELYHYEGVSRGKNLMVLSRRTLHRLEQKLFTHRWAKQIAAGDPYYTPNLTLRVEDCSLRW